LFTVPNGAIPTTGGIKRGKGAWPLLRLQARLDRPDFHIVA
jgi:hypothetical protein